MGSEERLVVATQKNHEASQAADDAKKLSDVEAMLERAEDRAETGETKVFELEEELTVVGNNLKSLGNAEEAAIAQEVQYKETVAVLQKKLKVMDARVEYAERTVKK